MALDGAFLRHIKAELEEKLIGGRVDKIHQPNRDEIVIALRTREAMYRLLLSARANSARVGLIEANLENPKQPPMLCMLFRKKLSGARLIDIRQPELERVLHFDFEALNELGDKVILSINMEIMGKYSNIILSDEEGRVVDALKRVDADMSSMRLVQPGMTYKLPPPQDKLKLLEADQKLLMERIDGLSKNMELSKALLMVLQGISPIVGRELQQQVGRGAFVYIKEMGEEDRFRLGFFYQKLKEMVTETQGRPEMVIDKTGKPIDFSFMHIQQYGAAATTKNVDSFSELLDSFYREKDSIERMRVKSQDLLKLLSNLSERLSRKINTQQAELKACENRDQFRVYGDLLSANMHLIPKGASSIRLQNFYNENGEEVDIKLNPELGASKNAQRYYKEYRKAKTAEKKLTEQMAIARSELEYLDTVFESLAMARDEQDLAEIREELAQEGYVRIQRKKRDKNVKISAPLEYIVADSFKVLVGRNNRQNDQLSMRTARKQDMWFHTKNIPGSHTVLLTEGREPSMEALVEAAELAAAHSRSKNSSQVPVDYTEIRNVSKPQGAKPGFVNYVNYKTLYVTPREKESME